METKYCQSCAMPMGDTDALYGTEKDGSKSELYCSYCYQSGAFCSPDIDTAEKMQKFCIEKMREQGMPKFIAWLFTRVIPKLTRWKE